MNDHERFNQYFLVTLSRFDREVCPRCGIGTVIKCPDRNTANMIVEKVNQSNLVFRASRLIILIKSGFIFSVGFFLLNVFFSRYIESSPQLLLSAAWLAVIYGSFYALLIITFYAVNQISRKLRLKKEIHSLINDPQGTVK